MDRREELLKLWRTLLDEVEVGRRKICDSTKVTLNNYNEVQKNKKLLEDCRTQFNAMRIALPNAEAAKMSQYLDLMTGDLKRAEDLLHSNSLEMEVVHERQNESEKKLREMKEKIMLEFPGIFEQK